MKQLEGVLSKSRMATQTECRMQGLVNIVCGCIGKISVDNCAQFIAPIQRSIPTEMVMQNGSLGKFKAC